MIAAVIAFSFAIIITPKAALAAEDTVSSNDDEDVQDSIDTVEGAGGGTVYLLSGNGTWDADVTISGNISLVGAGANVTIINTNENINLLIDDGADGTRVTGITFVHGDGDTGNGIEVGNSTSDDIEDWRIDHCDFWYYGNGMASIYIKEGTQKGLIDHCNIICCTSPPSSSGYGVEVLGDNTYTDNCTSLIGTAYLVYVEDCSFYDCRHAIASAWDSKYVFRHNVCITDYEAQQIDQHGQSDGSNHSGALAIAYDNYMTWTGGSNSPKAIAIRGGQGLLYDNVSDNFSYMTCWYVENDSYLDELVHDSYEWDNSPNDWFEYPNPTPYITEDVDYFPETEYSYTPYTYPHPLQSAGGGGGAENNPSAANITLTVTPGVVGGSCNASSYDFGNVELSTTSNTSLSYFGITNTSTLTSNWTLAVTSNQWTGGATPWTHSDTATAGNNTAGLKADRTSPWGGDDVAIPYSTGVVIYGDCAAETSFDFGLSAVAPTATSVNDEKTIILEVTVVAS